MDTFEEEEEIDLDALKKEISGLEKELVEVRYEDEIIWLTQKHITTQFHKELRLICSQRTTIDRQKRGLMQKLLTGKVRVGMKKGKKTQKNTDRQGQTWTKGMTDTGPILEIICQQAAVMSAVIFVIVGRCLSVSCPDQGRVNQHERE